MNLKNYANRWVETCSSTNDLAKQLLEQGYPHGTWIASRSQSEGRGRLGHRWVSEVGNLYLSMIVHIQQSDSVSWVPLASAVGCVQCLHSQFLKILPKIQWPNDIILDHQKLGGILCESFHRQGVHSIIIGLGLNCSTSPQELNRRTIHLSQMGIQTSPEDLSCSIREFILNQITQLDQQGPSVLGQIYEHYAYFKKGNWIEWSMRENPQQVLVGQVLGLGSWGELRVRDEKGQELSLFSEEVRLVKN